MEQKIFHGELDPIDFAQALMGEFNRGNLRAQTMERDKNIVVQITSRENPQAGGQTAMAVILRKVEDGVAVQLGEQDWIGVAASLGQSALHAWRNPWSLIERLDDIATDIKHLQLDDRVWEVIEKTAKSLGANYELSERLRSVVCIYCRTANPVGGSHCIGCGAPLGDTQPITCMNCGFIIKKGEQICPNCGQPVA
jgi:hypothetical protein